MSTIGPSFADSEDEIFLRHALHQAELAQEAGEVPIGACIRGPDGTLLATGQNRPIRDHDPSAHAEIVAMRQAGNKLGNYRLEGCTLYVTLEPCAMCAGAMIHARIARLVFAAFDPKAGAAGSVISLLDHPRLNHRVEVLGGVLAEPASGLLRAFFQSRRQERVEGTVSSGRRGCE